MRILITLMAFAACLSVRSQAFDTIVDRGIYRSYVNFSKKLPVAVTYTLHKGGGNAKRGDNWINETNIPVLTGRDYAGSGFDRGHLAPAEDFAFSDSLQDITFRYYNCIPQVPAFNRGKWRTLENKALKLSKLGPICVVNYVTYGMKNSRDMYVPLVCYKAVYDLRNGCLLWLVGCENTFDGKDVPITADVQMVCELLFKLQTKTI